MSTKIEWTEQTWNPMRGCRRISPGCEHCYAERQAARGILSGPGKPYEGLVQVGKQGSRWTGETAGPDVQGLMAPLNWKRGRRVFVCSMSDLFYEGHSDQDIAAVFGVMAACPGHVFQVLTKRAARALEWFTRPNDNGGAPTWAQEWTSRHKGVNWGGQACDWPLPNVWVGVSAEDQQRADERVPLLLQIPTAVRWVSYEPALGPVDWRPWLRPPCRDCGPIRVPGCTCPCHRKAGLDWIVFGGESGPGARPCDLAWARSTRDQCQEAGAAFFFKQAGAVPVMSEAAWRALAAQPLLSHINRHRVGPDQVPLLYHHKGDDLAELPEDLRFREYPAGR